MASKASGGRTVRLVPETGSVGRASAATSKLVPERGSVGRASVATSKSKCAPKKCTPIWLPTKKEPLVAAAVVGKGLLHVGRGYRVRPASAAVGNGPPARPEERPLTKKKRVSLRPNEDTGGRKAARARTIGQLPPGVPSSRSPRASAASRDSNSARPPLHVPRTPPSGSQGYWGDQWGGRGRGSGRSAGISSGLKTICMGGVGGPAAAAATRGKAAAPMCEAAGTRGEAAGTMGEAAGTRVEAAGTRGEAAAIRWEATATMTVLPLGTPPAQLPHPARQSSHGRQWRPGLRPQLSTTASIRRNTWTPVCDTIIAYMSVFVLLYFCSSVMCCG